MNKLRDGMLLYHGSYTAVEKIDLGRCEKAKDFGKGFYLTSNLTQAKKFIKLSLRKALAAGNVSADQNFGFISPFRYRSLQKELKTFEFPTTNQEWLWFIAQNRREHLAKQLRSRISADVYSAEIIIGKVADDNTNATITAYLSGLYGEVESREAVNDAIKRLMPEKLEDQFCFLTENAIQNLEFQEARKYVL